MRFIGILIAILSFTLCSCVKVLEPENNCEYSDNRSANADAAGVHKIRINAGAGYLRINGHPEMSEVKVLGTACAPRADLLENIKLHVYREENEIVIKSELSDAVSNDQLHLDIDLPDSIALEIHDTSGSIEIKQVKSLWLRDTSGSIRVENVSSDVYLEDSSGEISLNQIGGTVRLRDGSGNMQVRNVGGDVVVDSDGSGNIDISWVDKNVIIHSDGSGNIVVSNVKGDFILESDGSGSVNYWNIGGRVQLP